MANKTPRLGHEPITMQRVGADENLVKLGQFQWQIGESGKRTLVVLIPAANERGWTYSRWTIDHKNHCNASWSWDGNEDQPTLSPSLHAVGEWHGYVRRGQLIEA